MAKTMLVVVRNMFVATITSLGQFDRATMVMIMTMILLITLTMIMIALGVLVIIKMMVVVHNGNNCESESFYSGEISDNIIGNDSKVIGVIIKLFFSNDLISWINFCLRLHEFTSQ